MHVNETSSKHKALQQETSSKIKCNINIHTDREQETCFCPILWKLTHFGVKLPPPPWPEFPLSVGSEASTHTHKHVVVFCCCSFQSSCTPGRYNTQLAGKYMESRCYGNSQHQDKCAGKIRVAFFFFSNKGLMWNVWKWKRETKRKCKEIRFFYRNMHMTPAAHDAAPLSPSDVFIMSLTFNKVTSNSFGAHMMFWLSQTQISVKKQSQWSRWWAQLWACRPTCEQHFVS